MDSFLAIILLSAMALLDLTFASPQVISESRISQRNDLPKENVPTPGLNLTQLTCFPNDKDENFPSLPSANCLSAFQSFISTFQHVSQDNITFTSNQAEYGFRGFVPTPDENAPANEGSGPECGVVFAVYYGLARNRLM